MDNALYVGLSRQMTLRRQLDIVANNIANANTTGFKTEDLMVRTEQAKPAKTLDGASPVKFVLDDRVARDFTQGAMTKTGGDFDLAIEGTGFFHVQTAAGNRYTRDGRFTTNPEGQLVTQEGAQVLDGGGGPLLIDPAALPAIQASAAVVQRAAAGAAGAGVGAGNQPGIGQLLPGAVDLVARGAGIVALAIDGAVAVAVDAIQPPSFGDELHRAHGAVVGGVAVDPPDNGGL